MEHEPIFHLGTRNNKRIENREKKKEKESVRNETKGSRTAMAAVQQSDAPLATTTDEKPISNIVIVIGTNY